MKFLRPFSFYPVLTHVGPVAINEGDVRVHKKNVYTLGNATVLRVVVTGK